MRTFVVGDIHGWAEPLQELLVQIRPRAAAGDTLVFIGDYIDRGPDSRRVVDLVLEERTIWPGPVVTLKGNHEANMLEAIHTGSARVFAEWIMRCRAKATVCSYTRLISVASFAASLPTEHRDFFENLTLWYEDEHAIYVHAGLRPRVAPADNTEEDMLWIRDDFLRSNYAWPKPVVFGHTPQRELKRIASVPPTDPDALPVKLEQIVWRPLNLPETIGIDTGRAYGGPLTAVILLDREFVSVSPSL
jgi:serine/threonine protein phosphatase 1